MKKKIFFLLTMATILGLTACSSAAGGAASGKSAVAEEGAEIADDGEAKNTDRDLAESVVTEGMPMLPAGAQLSLAGSYTYHEHLEIGDQVIDSVWTLLLSEDGTYQLDAEIMGKPTTLTGTYEEGEELGHIITSVPDEGAPQMVVFFNSDGSCDWKVSPDGSCAPYSGPEGLPVVSGMPGEGEGAADADFSAVAYGADSPAQVMDIFFPDQKEEASPVIVLVHGGGFKFGSQTMELIRPVIDAGKGNGYVVASVDYRKSGEAVFPAAVADVKAAVRYLKENASVYGIDPEKIVIWGESAGAYLSLMTALTPQVEALDGDMADSAVQDSSVRALVDFYGPVEFFTMDEEYAALGRTDTGYSEAGSFESDFVGQPIGLDREFTYQTWWGSYMDQLPDDFVLDAWIQAGDADQSVPYTQSENFAEKLSEVIGEEHVQFSLIEGAAHEDPKFYSEENLKAVFEFLKDVLE